MNPVELEDYLHVHIPLSKAMQVSVVSIKAEGIVLSAPLAPNINHRETVFGGSLSAVATLAAWALVHSRLDSEKRQARLVIQRNTMEYEKPISGEFTAESFLPRPEDWDSLVRMLSRKGRARITVAARLVFAGQTVGRFEGEFVALGKADG